MRSRRTRHLRWEALADWCAPARAGLGVFAAPRDVATKLLHIGAEVEHSLAVQYLYAAYSLGGWQPGDKEREQAQTWQRTILEIAREEMAHLATIQNLLIAIGSPLSFDREEFPATTDLYPFPFELQKLTRRTLGMYVLAEMPDSKVLEDETLVREIDDIKAFVGGGNMDAVHRVGHIYDWTRELIKPSSGAAGPGGPVPRLGSSDFSADSLQFQVRPDEWGLGYQDLLIMNATDRDSAAAAIEAIADQGEGTSVRDIASSHFGKFLEIYRAFPDEQAPQPARNVATNPTIDEIVEPGRLITNKAARAWAGLFNLRYRMLLMFLSHSFRVEAPLPSSGRTPRGLLISWTFGEMYNLRSIADILMELPLADSLDVRAGPPFEMPYSIALPRLDVDCWRLHRELLRASQLYVQQLQSETGLHKEYLEGLSSANVRALQQVDRVIAG